jgi:hypothetical protein
MEGTTNPSRQLHPINHRVLFCLEPRYVTVQSWSKTTRRHLLYELPNSFQEPPTPPSNRTLFRERLARDVPHLLDMQTVGHINHWKDPYLSVYICNQLTSSCIIVRPAKTWFDNKISKSHVTRHLENSYSWNQFITLSSNYMRILFSWQVVFL